MMKRSITVSAAFLVALCKGYDTRLLSVMNPYKASASTAKVSGERHRSVYWFRNALRLHDNPSLTEACAKSSHLLPLYIIDPAEPFAQTRGRRAGAIRANFILESIHDLVGRQNVNMLVAVGDPKLVLPSIMRLTNCNHLFYEQDPAAPVRQHDTEILQCIRDDSALQDVAIHSYATHTLHPLESYAQRCKDNVAPLQFDGFRKIFVKMTLRDEVPTLVPDSFPPLPWDNSQTIPPLLQQQITLLSESELANPATIMESYLGYTHVAQALEKRVKGGLDLNFL